MRFPVSSFPKRNGAVRIDGFAQALQFGYFAWDGSAKDRPGDSRIDGLFDLCNFTFAN